MESSASASASRVLVVAHKTAATQPLLDAVRDVRRVGVRVHAARTQRDPRPAQGRRPRGSGRERGPYVLDRALPLLEQAAGGPVDGLSATPTRSRPCTTRSTCTVSTR